ncbi:MAG: DNA polymerase I, partial [Campylobacterales bacterium]|nr:DNA polymerase I [Campylobacterales bacterium]
MQSKQTITIIDTFGFLFRSYFALPPLKSKSGFPTGMLTGFMNFIATIGKDFQTDYLVFALDAKGPSFRNEIYDQYKAHRPEAPEDLKIQLPIAIEFIEKMGFPTASKVGYEADDIIASLAHDAISKGLEVRIVSHDKDLYQLINDDIYMFDPIKKKKIQYTECFEKYGVYPTQFVDYQALIGDSADNVPGVKGIGAKTAQALIKQFNTLENIYENLNVIEKPRWQKLLIESKEMAFISKKLVTLHNDAHCIDNIGDLETLKLPSQNPILKIAPLLAQYDMNKIIDKVHKDGLSYKTTIPQEYDQLLYAKQQPKEIECSFILLDTKEKLDGIINLIPKNSIIAIDTETTSLDTKTASIVGFSFCWEESKSYYVPIGHFYLGVEQQVCLEDAKDALLKLNLHKLVFHNYKFDQKVIETNFGFTPSLYADTMIMAWLLDSDKAVGMDKLASHLLDGYKTISFGDLVKKDQDFSSVNIEEACKYAAEDTYVTFRLFHKILELYKLKDEEYLFSLAKRIEFPFISVLSAMESRGIKIDVEFFQSLQHKSQENLSSLTKAIHILCNEEFNINSSKQLGVILFEKLGLPSAKKTKSGYSTNENVLSSLLHKHPVIEKIIEYRESFKLHSTYIEPLLQYAKSNEENRIFTSFLQTGTATGRLSSKNPNLQNIPVRTEAGRQIREGFVAKNGYKLMGVDYSQIELRLLAHFSGDKDLCEAFNSNRDIHLETAIKIFGENDAKDKRNIAKSINFGLI